MPGCSGWVGFYSSQSRVPATGYPTFLAGSLQRRDPGLLASCAWLIALQWRVRLGGSLSSLSIQHDVCKLLF